MHELREEAKAAMDSEIHYDQVWEHRREARDKRFTVRMLSDGIFRVEGPQIERMVVQTDWENEEAIAYLQHRFKKIGLDKELEKAGARDGDEIRIVGRAFEYEGIGSEYDDYDELDEDELEDLEA